MQSNNIIVNLMESVSEVKRFDYAVDELLQVRDALLNKILEDNKHRFT